MMRVMMVLLCGVSLALAVACDRQKAPPSQAPQSTAPEPAQPEKQGYESTVQKELDTIRFEIERLKTDAKAATAQTKVKLEEQVVTLEQKWQVAEKRLEELKIASGEAWRDFRAGVDAAMEDLRQTFSNTKKESA